MQPTTTSTPAVAADGMAEMTGERKADRAKQMATTTEVRPVRPPAAIPAEDSTYVVVLEVPQMAPMEVAIESANRALSILEEKPEPFSRASSSSAEKMPVRRPVPMNVPMVSKVSDMENAKIVSRMIGSFDMSENSDGKPSALKIAPKVCGSWAKVSPMEMELAMVV